MSGCMGVTSLNCVRNFHAMPFFPILAALAIGNLGALKPPLANLTGRGVFILIAAPLILLPYWALVKPKGFFIILVAEDLTAALVALVATLVLTLLPVEAVELPPLSFGLVMMPAL